MRAVVEAMKHWGHLAPLLTPPQTEAEYDALVLALDEVLDEGGADEANPLSLLADRMGDLISSYDDEHYALEERGVDALIVLMKERNLKQRDLSDIASQGVISEILRGKRPLNLSHIVKLASKFGVPEQVFISHTA